MSELIQKNDSRATIRWKLLTGASALVLTAYVSSTGLARAEDAGQSQVWIELGAQMERATGGDRAFSPPFFGLLDSGIDSPEKVANESPWAFGADGKISFQPADSGFIFSAGIRYGRSSNRRSTNPQERIGPYTNILKYYDFQTRAFHCCTTYQESLNGDYADTQSRRQEDHLILDFQAGREVGLGLFGSHGTSVVSGGVRFAQFASKSNLTVHADGDTQVYNGFTLPGYSYYLSKYPQLYYVAAHHRIFSLAAQSSRNFKGIGPSISWDASAALAGNSETSELTFDWGVNAALLFGKQKTSTYHQSTSIYHRNKYGDSTDYVHPGVNRIRERNVVVPNIGGMAGFSIKFPNAKVSIGYRADIFFNAIDGGWDSAKKENRSFMGPYASISIGLGD